MALTRAQYLSGNTANGPVLPGQPQGVRPGGSGIKIAADGTISVDPTTITGVVKLNNEAAYNAYLWPDAGPTVPSALTANASGTISWVPIGGDGGIGTVTSINVTGGTTGLTFSGGPITTSGTLVMDGVLDIGSGGTGGTTRNQALNNLLPDQAGEVGHYLSTDGTNTLWVAAADGLPPQEGQAGKFLYTDGSNASWSISGVEVGSAPPTGVVDGSLYWDNNLGAMFINYNDGFNTQWVQDVPTGGGGGGRSVPEGAVLAFFMPAAPTGYTQLTTQNNKAIRIVSGAGGGSGGTLGFSTVFGPSAAYNGSLTITSGNVGDTTLSVDQLAAHTHTYSTISGGGASGGGGARGGPTVDTSSTGGDQSHTHTLVGVVAEGNFVSNFDLEYVDMILAVKG